MQVLQGLYMVLICCEESRLAMVFLPCCGECLNTTYLCRVLKTHWSGTFAACAASSQVLRRSSKKQAFDEN